MRSLLLAPVHFVDYHLNRTTMYRVVLYSLLAMAVLAVIFGFTGVLTYGGTAMLLSLIIVCAACWASNAAFAKLWKVPANKDSWLITALILFFLFSPIIQIADIYVIIAASVLAMASKYVLAWNGKHLFNPAAIAAAVIALSGTGAALWWVGAEAMLPLTAVVSFLIVRKIGRYAMFFSCIIASFVVIIALGLTEGLGIVDTVMQHLISWPILFFAAVMVTEPLTMPPRKSQQMVYGALVGALSSWPVVIGPVYFSPEIALMLGNIYAYCFSLRRRLKLRLKEKRLIAKDTYEFAFHLEPKLAFSPGQYLEWNLQHAHPDDRGNRRTFTIASAPSEEDLMLGVKIGAARSTYKEKLHSLKPGDTMYAGQLAGDFTLPSDPKRKLVFIAGGIGITPFRSMIKHLVDTKQVRDIILFYANRTMEDIAYNDVIHEAGRAIGLRTVFIVNDATARPADALSSFTESAVQSHAPDFMERTFYISGPNGMVDAYKELLLKMGVRRTNVITDYFPGFA